MTLQDFSQTYCLHDSLLTKIVYNKFEKELYLDLEFCFWAQTGYCENDPDVGMVRLKFTEVSRFVSDGLSGEIDYYSILDFICNDNLLTINVFDDFNDACYTLEVVAEFISMETF